MANYYDDDRPSNKKAGNANSITFINVLNVCGSVASLTGISLLWARGTLTPAQLTVAIPYALIAVALFLACAAIAFELFRFGLTLTETWPDGFRWAYVFLAFAGALYGLYGLGMVLYHYVEKQIPVT
jgi:hypothetical protein